VTKIMCNRIPPKYEVGTVTAEILCRMCVSKTRSIGREPANNQASA
jgi:hypothetical protein